MKKEISKKALTKRQAAELAALAALPEDQIDTQDIPEQKDWSGARRGVFFRPVKKQLTLRLDADLIEWFKNQAAAKGKGYQTGINTALRQFVTLNGRSTTRLLNKKPTAQGRKKPSPAAHAASLETD